MSQRDAHYRRKFGASEQEMIERLERYQDGKCYICFTPIQIGRTAVVDHDHETKRYRGIICYRCNSGLGCFNDNAWMVRNALGYLLDFLDTTEEKSEERKKYNYMAKEVFGDARR